jgi:hypothetical protein
MICQVISLQSLVMTHLFFKDITSSCNEVFKDYESDMAVRIGKLRNPTSETASSHVIVKRIVGTEILTLELQANTSDLRDIAFIFAKLYTRIY